MTSLKSGVKMVLMIEKNKVKKSFHTKGILILIFLTFVLSFPEAIGDYNSNPEIGDIVFVGTFIFESLGEILFSAIMSVILTFFVNKFKFNKKTFYKIFFYLMFLPILLNIIDYVNL